MPESKTSDVQWELWCRLCAKDDTNSNVNIVFKNEQEDRSCTNMSLAETIFKYFGIQMDEALPKMLCTECFSFMTSLVNFAERVGRVNQMFQKLLNDSENKSLDYQTLRLQFGILDTDREHIFIPQTSLNEIHYFDSKPKIDILEEKIFEDDITLTTNPLEQQTVNVKESKENQLNKSSSNSENSKDSTDQDFTLASVENTSESESSDSEEFLPLRNENKIIKDPNNVIIKQNRKQLRSLKDDIKQNEDTDNISNNKNGGDIVITKKRLHRKGDVYACTECPRVFKRLQHFRQHMSRTHSISPSSSSIRKCSQCPERSFSTQHQLERHLKVHLPPELKRIVPCPYCDKKFASNSIVQTHIKYIHNNDRSFICEECGVTMRTNAALKAHMLTHTDFAPFECEICKKRFKNQIRLKNHMETHDPHKHICAECGLQLNSRATLNRHLLVHSDEMLHKCDYCGRAFKRAKALKNHLILHTGLKPYSCDFCDRTFANGSNCRSHKKKAHPEELAALEASGGGKQYTRNIPKLEALKAVTKSADNLAPVVSKQSGRFAFGKKPRTAISDVTSFSTPILNTPSEQICQMTAKRSPDGSSSGQVGENIYTHMLKHAIDLQKDDQNDTIRVGSNTISSHMNNMAISDVAIHLQNHQLLLPDAQTISQPHTPASLSEQKTESLSPRSTNNYHSQIIKLPVQHSPTTTNLSSHQQVHLHQQNSTSLLCQTSDEIQRHQNHLNSLQSPQSQASHHDDHSNSPSVPFYSHTRRDLQQGAFI